MRKKDHLTHLHVTFPHRTVEALKKRLQFLKWTRPETSMELQQQSPTRDYVPDQRDQTTTRTTGPTWTTEAERLPTQSNTQQDNLPINRAANKRGKSSKNWSEDEDKLLTEEAMKMWVVGMTKRELANKLHSCFHCRTAEAIRKRLQNLNWTIPTVIRQREPSSIHITHRPEGSPTPPLEPTKLAVSTQTPMLDQSIPLRKDIVTPSAAQPVNVELWRKDMLEKACQSLEADRFQLEKLKKWILDILEGGGNKVRRCHDVERARC